MTDLYERKNMITKLGAIPMPNIDARKGNC
jgi:hypothetical protein